MEQTYKKIKTEVGYIEPKRGAIYLDFFKQKSNTLNFIGEISSNMCERKSKHYQWYKYQLLIKGVKEYQAIGIEEYYKKRIHTESAFSEMLGGTNGETNLRTLIIETYDWAYIVVCESFEFTILGGR